MEAELKRIRTASAALLKKNKRITNILGAYSGQYYKTFNNLLRGIPYEDTKWTDVINIYGNPQTIREVVDELIDFFDSHAVPTTQRKVILYRGLEDNKILKHGGVFLDKGFTSTTADETAAGFRFTGNKCCLLRMVIPKGIKVLNINSVSVFPTEDEFLFGPGSSWKTKKLTEKFAKGAFTKIDMYSITFQKKKKLAVVPAAPSKVVPAANAAAPAKKACGKKLVGKKYSKRKAPLFQSKNCAGQTLAGKNGQLYLSKKLPSGKYRWVVVKNAAANKQKPLSNKKKKCKALEKIAATFAKKPTKSHFNDLAKAIQHLQCP